ncbi:hypothetical protein GPECTOR_13g714 [Gonium pectorale]|uniref:Thiamine pyrophosphate enzyme TPP-binding domain-containing protein n=1 Tax=Gonium pectorale TaxID=33097 RepID=A0A150GN38_GONPE|nr:hypothetical protein GPECTOR_13g714 [Gonium pectorale]|eukprot:KXZ51227.1 hypothetical protein GPECTOR_13g714 [Gonium pectorale]
MSSQQAASSNAAAAVAAVPAGAAAAAAAPPAATGAEALLRAAVAAGADVVFANPGTTEMWLVAAMDTLWPAVRPVLCLHENVATGAADGYARVARRPALTLLHLGPGLANGLANLHNARRARSPVVNLVGDMATWHRDNDPPLNSPIEALAASVSGVVLVAGSGQRSVQGAGFATQAGGGGGGAAGGAESGGGAADLAADLTAAMAAAALTAPAPAGSSRLTQPGSRVVTVIIPHDLSWEPPIAQPLAAPPAPAGAVPASAASAVEAEAAEAFVRDCAAALLKAAATARARSASAAAAAGGSGGGGSGVALYLGGEALLADRGALLAAGQIAAATGAVLLCEGAFARADRGAGLPPLRRLPYFPQEAAAELAKYGCLVLVDARPPVANFGYKGAPGRLLRPQEDDPTAVWEFDPAALAAAGWDAATALRRLAAALGPAATSVRPLVNCRGAFASPRRPPLPPPGRLTPAALCSVVAALQPEGAVVVDESLTSGSSYWEASQGCPPFVHLTLTGGAIGSGPPMALGAAVALAASEQTAKDVAAGAVATGSGSGDATAATGASAAAAAAAPASAASGRRRRVINLQADGSAMYSLQALWSQAREQLPVTTIVCANSSYAILRVEAARQRLPGVGPATRALTDLSSPRLDWVALAGGMGVPAARVDTTEGLAEQLTAALQMPGPFLIQANL